LTCQPAPLAPFGSDELAIYCRFEPPEISAAAVGGLPEGVTRQPNMGQQITLH
jgi:hypothetical protein